MELLAGTLQPETVLADQAASQTELGAVEDLDCVLEIVRLDAGEDRAENLLLGDGVGLADTAENGRLDKIATLDWLATQLQLGALLLGGLDVVQDVLVRRSVDHCAQVVVVAGMAHLELLGPLDHLGHQLIVDRRGDNQSAQGAALLALEAEGCCHGLVRCEVQVCRLVHDHRVLAAHLQDGPLQPDLARLGLGCQLVDVQADLFRTGEGDHAGLGMAHQGVANLAAATGAEVNRLGRKTGFKQHFQELGRDHRRRAGGLEHHRVARDQCSNGHAAHNRQREVPRRNHHHHAQGLVVEIVLFARPGAYGLGATETHHLAGVVFQKVDRLGHIAIRLEEVLRLFVGLQRGELVLALADTGGGLQQNAGTHLRVHPAPLLLPVVVSRLHSLFGQLLCSLAHGADDGIRVSGVAGFNPLFRRHPLAINQQIMVLAQLALDLLQRILVRLLILLDRKIGPRLVLVRQNGHDCASCGVCVWSNVRCCTSFRNRLIRSENRILTRESQTAPGGKGGTGD